MYYVVCQWYFKLYEKTPFFVLVLFVIGNYWIACVFSKQTVKWHFKCKIFKQIYFWKLSFGNKMKSLNIREADILDKIKSYFVYLQVHFYMILLPKNYFENHSTNSAQLSRIARDRSQRLRLSISLGGCNYNKCWAFYKVRRHCV